eukprot:scaffold149027_cov43-Tisochrysis_lutea.AAC.1
MGALGKELSKAGEKEREWGREGVFLRQIEQLQSRVGQGVHRSLRVPKGGLTGSSGREPFV